MACRATGRQSSALRPLIALLRNLLDSISAEDAAAFKPVTPITSKVDARPWRERGRPGCAGSSRSCRGPARAGRRRTRGPDRGRLRGGLRAPALRGQLSASTCGDGQGGTIVANPIADQGQQRVLAQRFGRGNRPFPQRGRLPDPPRGRRRSARSPGAMGRTALMRPDGGGGFKAVHLRHLAVHQTASRPATGSPDGRRPVGHGATSIRPRRASRRQPSG